MNNHGLTPKPKDTETAEKNATTTKTATPSSVATGPSTSNIATPTKRLETINVNDDDNDPRLRAHATAIKSEPETSNAKGKAKSTAFPKAMNEDVFIVIDSENDDEEDDNVDIPHSFYPVGTKRHPRTGALTIVGFKQSANTCTLRWLVDGRALGGSGSSHIQYNPNYLLFVDSAADRYHSTLDTGIGKEFVLWCQHGEYDFQRQDTVNRERI